MALSARVIFLSTRKPLGVLQGSYWSEYHSHSAVSRTEVQPAYFPGTAVNSLFLTGIRSDEYKRCSIIKHVKSQICNVWKVENLSNLGGKRGEYCNNAADPTQPIPSDQTKMTDMKPHRETETKP